jgi:membrane protein implicated in regulation of membrane protease activity
MSAIVSVLVETLAGPLLFLAVLYRAVLLCGCGLFLIAAPFAHKSLRIALLYLVHVVLMTVIIRFLRRARARALYRV